MCFFIIPVRGGVVLLSAFGMLLGLIMVLVAAVSSGIANKSAVDVEAVLYSFLAAASAFGMIGAIQRRQDLIEYFLWFLLGHAFLSIVTGIFLLVVVFQNAAEAMLSCPTTGAARSDCISSITMNRNLSVPGVIVLWALHFYTVWVVRDYRDQLRKEDGDDEDDEKLIGKEKSRPKTTFASPLEATLAQTPGDYNPTTPLAPSQGTYNRNLTPIQRNFSQPNRGPAPPTYQSEVPLPSAATRTTFPDRVKTTVSHKRRSSTATYFDPTSFYLDQRYSTYGDHLSAQDREPPPPVPPLHPQYSLRRYDSTSTHSRSDSGGYSQPSLRRNNSTHSRSDSGGSLSTLSDDYEVSFDTLEEMLNPGGGPRQSLGSELSSVPSLRRPPRAAPRRF